jgi:hypothetical protein
VIIIMAAIERRVSAEMHVNEVLTVPEDRPPRVGLRLGGATRLLRPLYASRVWLLQLLVRQLSAKDTSFS